MNKQGILELGRFFQSLIDKQSIQLAMERLKTHGKVNGKPAKPTTMLL